MSTYPTVQPSITLDFQKSKQLDPRIAFSRSSAATYVEGGLVKNAYTDQARFEEDKGLLIEESRTNYCKNYSAFYYAYSNATIASGLSPAGDNTAQVITATANGMTSARTTGGLKPVNIPTNSVGITCSLYVKGSYSYFRLKIFAGGASQQQVIFRNFNTDSWTVSSNNSATRPSSNYQVQDAGNGWYRLSFFASNYTAAQTIGALWFDGSASLSAGDTYSVWMPQVEIGTFPTSAIPTEVASEVTRAADVAQITGNNLSSWYNITEGTVCSKAMSPLDLTTSRLVWHFRDPGRKEHNADNGFQWYDLGTGYSTNGSTYVAGVFNKQAYAYSSVVGSSTRACLNGTFFYDKTVDPNITPSAHTTLSLGSNVGVNIFVNGYIQRFSYYTRRLTDSELQTITL